ncbi:MAG: hypothetical protein ACHQF0_05750 [Chitinophagales bacterium]
MIRRGNLNEGNEAQTVRTYPDMPMKLWGWRVTTYKQLIQQTESLSRSISVDGF